MVLEDFPLPLLSWNPSRFPQPTVFVSFPTRRAESPPNSSLLFSGN